MVSQGMFASPIITVDKSDAMKKTTAEEIENYSNMLLGAEEKLKQLNGQTIEETVKNPAEACRSTPELQQDGEGSVASLDKE